jgi:signal transduction histidine kinase
MFKNLTPKTIALYASCLLGIFIGSMYAIVAASPAMSFVVKMLLMILVPTLLTYIVINFALERYIYRRIKLIYKTIRQAKVSMPEKAMKVGRDNSVLDKVEREVEEWAAMRENEINTLKTLEQYRKRFLGNVAHELKTPIFSIQGFVHTLLDGAINDNAVNLRYLQRAALNIERPPSEVRGVQVTQVIDYQTGEAARPAWRKREAMVQLELADHTRLLVRPSGTEPKLKIYADRKDALGDGGLWQSPERGEPRAREFARALADSMGL